MEKFGTKLYFIPIIVVITSIQPLDYWTWSSCYLLPSSRLSLTPHLYHRHYAQNKLPGITFTLLSIGRCCVLLGQTISLEFQLAHWGWDLIFLRVSVLLVAN